MAAGSPGIPGRPGVLKVEHPRLNRLYEYWRSKVVDGRLPARADIEPRDIPDLLSIVYLVDVTAEPERYRFRLVGTEITGWIGRDPTGMYLDHPDFGPHGPLLAAQFRDVAASRRPAYLTHQAPWSGREFYHYEKVLMPLAADGLHVDMVLGGLNVMTPPLR